jgi:hypothetical protein
MGDLRMTEQVHPLAPHHMPFFITAPGQTDGLFIAMGIFVLLAIIGIGVVYFKLHALPEHMAHRGQKVQFEIVAVLALLALFTHNHAFWIAGLLLALVPLPDISTPLTSMAQSLRLMAAPAAPAQLATVVADDHPSIEKRGD